MACAARATSPAWPLSSWRRRGVGTALLTWQEATRIQPHFAISETPRFVGRAVAALAADPDKARFNGESLSSGGLAQVYGFTDLDGSRPDAWRFIADGRPKDVTPYR